MAVILFNGAEPFEKNWQYAFDRRPDVKSGEYCSNSFRKKKYNLIHVYSPGVRADKPQGTKV